MRQDIRMRTPTLLGLSALTAAVLAIGLAGCAPDSTPDDTANTATDSPASIACTPSGTASDAVKVTGELGATPKVSFSAPDTTTITQRTTVITGKGVALAEGDSAKVFFSLYSGTSGDLLTSTGYTAATDLTPLPVDEQQVLAGLAATLRCATVGSRVVGVIAPADGFGATGSTDAGVDPNETLIFVVDVMEGPTQPVAWTDNVPTVTFDGKIPTVTLPKTPPPTDLLVKVLTPGTGKKVTSTDSVTLDYHGVSWDTGEVFDESFTKTPLTLAANKFVPGFTAAIVGQKVGTTLIVSIPPEDAYGTDPEAAQLGGQTLFFVIKIEKVG
jgi:FKBP-type peptidyl-prolyl cis-trans isomerase